MHIRTVDLFAGCGGLSLGFQNAGFEVVAAVEHWQAALDCYKANFKHPCLDIDLSDPAIAIPAIQEFRPELIIGGPPCQDFSSAGKREEKDRANLTICYAQIIAGILPRAFVMENVDLAKKSKAFAIAADIYHKAGYGLTKILLDASHCGVPQKRKRFFCIGLLGAQDDFLLEHINSRITEKETSLSDYYGDSLGFQYYYRHPRNYNRRAVFSVDEAAPTMRGVNRPIPPGYHGNPLDAAPIGPNIHVLSVQDRALIQTFPKSYHWVGKKTEIEQMIGNAVPVKLAEFVAKSVMTIFQPQTQQQKLNDFFLKWLLDTQNLSIRSARDVLCRKGRVEQIIGPIVSHDADTVIFIFERKANQNKVLFTSTVLSQLRRSIRLYCEFLSSVKPFNK